jgi:holo-[acyl-carrier protein] synthase
VTTLNGVDIQSVEEVATSLEEFGRRYTRLLFTNHEVETCGKDPTTLAGKFAARFAAKEAVLKILDTREAVPSWRAIEVRDVIGGRPRIVLYGEAADLANRQGIEEISLSISQGGGVAIAAVVATFAVPTVADKS